MLNLKPVLVASVAVPFMALAAACAAVPGASVSTEAAPSQVTTTAAGTVEVPDVGEAPGWVIAIHGGAGVINPDRMTPETKAAYNKALAVALEAGGAVLARGGSGPEAIEAALITMEDDPLFNAGRGGVLDSTGNVRHDASIMRGDTLDAGAITGSTRIKNPITAARAMMGTQNVMVLGDGADWFAAEEGLELIDPMWFQTERRRGSLLRAREANPGQVAALEEAVHDTAFGTVGAVVLDREGNISAGTSTGGRTNKRFGRVGDSPIIGAGTYASNASCAVSATGHGEWFMRYTVARDICAQMELAGESLEDASRHVVIDTLGPLGGEGATIAIDASGKVVFSMNVNGTYRGVMSSGTRARTAVYADEEVN
jgi:beta-aspartyl-peptidase (threonine type)